jgi:hypothetical protein
VVPKVASRKDAVRRIASRKVADLMVVGRMVVGRKLAALKDVDLKDAVPAIVVRRRVARKLASPTDADRKVAAPKAVARIRVESRKPVRRVKADRVAKLPKEIASLKAARVAKRCAIASLRPVRATANVASRADEIKLPKSNSRNRSSRRNSVKRIGRSTSTASSI